MQVQIDLEASEWLSDNEAREEVRTPMSSINEGRQPQSLYRDNRSIASPSPFVLEEENSIPKKSPSVTLPTPPPEKNDVAENDVEDEKKESELKKPARPSGKFRVQLDLSPVADSDVVKDKNQGSDSIRQNTQHPFEPPTDPTPSEFAAAPQQKEKEPLIPDPKESDRTFDPERVKLVKQLPLDPQKDLKL